MVRKARSRLGIQHRAPSFLAQIGWRDALSDYQHVASGKVRESQVSDCCWIANIESQADNSGQGRPDRERAIVDAPPCRTASRARWWCVGRCRSGVWLTGPGLLDYQAGRYAAIALPPGLVEAGRLLFTLCSPRRLKAADYGRPLTKEHLV